MSSLTGSESCGEEVFVGRIPAETRDLQILGPLERKLPERQQGALGLAELVGGVFPIFEIWIKLKIVIEMAFCISRLWCFLRPLIYNCSLRFISTKADIISIEIICSDLYLSFNFSLFWS